MKTLDQFLSKCIYIELSGSTGAREFQSMICTNPPLQMIETRGNLPKVTATKGQIRPRSQLPYSGKLCFQLPF